MNKTMFMSAHRRDKAETYLLLLSIVVSRDVSKKSSRDKVNIKQIVKRESQGKQRKRE